MIQFTKTSAESFPAIAESVDKLYPDTEQYVTDRTLLSRVIQALALSPSPYRGSYTAYIEQQALDKFLNHSNQIYRKHHNEATGIFVGYYLHNPLNASQRVFMAIDFLPSYSGTSVTCEISCEDAARFAKHCREHKVEQGIWPHTHPFNMELFYSSVDSGTLKRVFNASHQMGVVCDNLRNDYMGFKIIDGKECKQSLYSFNLDLSLREGIFVTSTLYLSPSDRTHKTQDKVVKPINTQTPVDDPTPIAESDAPVSASFEGSSQEDHIVSSLKIFQPLLISMLVIQIIHMLLVLIGILLFIMANNELFSEIFYNRL